MKRTVFLLSLAVVVGFLAGCGDDDGGSSDLTNVNVDISGAQNAHWAYDGTHDVYCTDDNGTLHVRAAPAPATQADSIEMVIHGFTGQGNYDFTYDPQDAVHNSVEVQVGDDYFYHYNYDVSALDGTEVFSHCWVVIHGNDEYLGVDVSCDDLPAQPTSADYEANPVEFQPSVNVEGLILCPLTTL